MNLSTIFNLQKGECCRGSTVYDLLLKCFYNSRHQLQQLLFHVWKLACTFTSTGSGSILKISTFPTRFSCDHGVGAWMSYLLTLKWCYFQTNIEENYYVIGWSKLCWNFSTIYIYIYIRMAVIITDFVRVSPSVNCIFAHRKCWSGDLFDYFWKDQINL